MKYLFLLVIVFILFSCAEGVSEVSDEPNTELTETDEAEKIQAKIKEFSEHVVAGDYGAVGNMYSKDAKIFPTSLDIVQGRDSITAYWDHPSDYTVSYHKVTPEEIKVLGDEAYDYGYYEGKSMDTLGNEFPWKGKYVIVWKKEASDWKIYLDIWNNIED